MHRYGLVAVAASFMLVSPGAECAELHLSPPPDCRFAIGQRFDIRAALPGAGALTWSVTLDGVSLAASESRSGIWLRRDVSLSTPGAHRVKAEARNEQGAVVGAAEREIHAVAWQGREKTRAKNVILLVSDGMGVAHRVAARTFLFGIKNGRPGGFLEMETLPVTGMLATSSLSGLVTDSAAAGHALATGTKTANWMIGVFPDETPDRDDDNARVEQLPSLLARTRGMVMGFVTTAAVGDATPAAFFVHTGDRGSDGAVTGAYLAAAREGVLRVVMGGGRKSFPPGPGGALESFSALGFAVGYDATSLAAALKTRPQRLLGLFHDSHMSTSFDVQHRGDPNVVKDFPDQPSLETMTRAALAVLAPNPRGFCLLVEGANIDRQAHAADQERMVWEVLAFDRAVAAAMEFAHATNEDADPANDTLVIVVTDHETGGVVLPGVGDPARLGTRDYVRTFDTGGLPDAADANRDGFPDDPNPARKPIIHFAAGPDRYEDWQPQPRPIPAAVAAAGRDRIVYPNGDRDGGTGVLLTGVIENSVPARSVYSPALYAHTAVDVPVAAYGPGAAALAGARDNTDVFPAILRAVGGSSGTPR